MDCCTWCVLLSLTLGWLPIHTKCAIHYKSHWKILKNVWAFRFTAWNIHTIHCVGTISRGFKLKCETWYCVDVRTSDIIWTEKLIEVLLIDVNLCPTDEALYCADVCMVCSCRDGTFLAYIYHQGGGSTRIHDWSKSSKLSVKILHCKWKSCIQNCTEVKLHHHYQQNVLQLSKVKVLIMY